MSTGQYPKRRESDEQAAQRVEKLRQRAERRFGIGQKYLLGKARKGGSLRRRPQT